MFNGKYHNFVMDRALQLKQEDPNFDENTFIAGAACAYFYMQRAKWIPTYWLVFPDINRSVLDGYGEWLEAEKVIAKN